MTRNPAWHGRPRFKYPKHKEPTVAKKSTAKIVFEPIGSRIVVKRDDVTEVSPGGIVLPGRALEKPRLGTVIAVGPGPRNSDGTRGTMQVKEGDRVVIQPFAESVELSQDEFVLVREEDVLAIVREE